MLNLLSVLTIASLLLPTGFDFLSAQPADNSFPLASNNQTSAPRRIANNSLGLKTTAKGIIVMDNASGEVLYRKNVDEVLPIASITKLVTALVVLDTKPDWQKKVVMTKADRREGNIIQVREGDEVTAKDLFYLMLVSSTNEAAAALARVSGLSDFAKAMNLKARELKMTGSYFTDPSGLDPENVSTASDLVKLAQAAFRQKEIIDAVKTKQYTFSLINTKRLVRAVSTDQLLDSFLNKGDYEVIGAKTGYLSEVSYCLLLQVQKIKGPALTVVLLGAETMADRWQEAKGLVDWVGRNYQW